MAEGQDLKLSLKDLEEEWTFDAIPRTEQEPHGIVQSQWAMYGVVQQQVFAAQDPVLSEYEQAWYRSNYDSPGGWDYATPYMDHSELLRVGCDGNLAALLEEIIGEPMGLHLCLTGWTSTQRDWHRDQYLNEPYVGGFYAAVWLALDDIHPHAGPFQYVLGSHRGAPISQKKIREALGEDGNGPDWPTHSERILTPLFEEQLATARIETHVPAGRGQVLVWHGRLLHRGSVPKNPYLERRALIMHFSGIGHRPDMPPAVQHEAGGWYFPLGGRQPVR